MADADAPFLTRVGTDEPLTGVSDYLGRPVYRSTSGGWRSAIFVVVLEFANAFAFFGVSANLITYLTGPLAQSNATAAIAVNAWSGTATLTPLLGAFVADSWLGRYRSIILACILYVLGYGMITLQGPDSPCALAFAADQFDPSHPREYAARGSMFNWWYFCLATGITIAVGGVSYIQENLGWGIGFGMLCTIVLCASIVFLIGTPTYRLYAPAPGSDNPFTLLARSIVTLSRNNNATSNSLLSKTMQYQLGDEDDVAKQDEARCVLRILSIWAACLSYGVVFAQVVTLFNKQGRTLDRRITDRLELPPAILQAFGPATVLLFMPFYECVLVPVLRCVTGNPSGLTLLQRLGTGLAMSLAAVSTAALVEAQRLEIAREHGLVDVAGAMVPMSWVWLLPQYTLIGMGCVFAEVGMQEFFYDQMPHELRSLGLALYCSVIGIGSFVSGALISLIDRITKSSNGDSWFADNLNRAHLDYFYWVLAGLSAAEFTLFLCLASSYAYNNHKGPR